MLMRYHSLLIPACILGLVGVTVGAQTAGGNRCCQSLSPRIQAGIMTANEESDRNRALR